MAVNDSKSPPVSCQSGGPASSQSGDKTLPRILTGTAPKIDLIRPMKEHTFEDDIVGLRTTLSQGTTGDAFSKVKEDPRLIPITLAAMTDYDLAIAGNAELLIMQLASSSSLVVKKELRSRLRAFFASKWMSEEKASGSWRYDDIRENLGPVLMNLEL